MDKGASGVIALLAQALAKGREENTLAFPGDPLTQGDNAAGAFIHCSAHIF
jgi:hypothetical protein